MSTPLDADRLDCCATVTVANINNDDSTISFAEGVNLFSIHGAAYPGAEMYRVAFLIVACIGICGCAEKRIIVQSGEFSADMHSLPVREVLYNLSRSIDDPHYIPSRTTFGNGKLTMTDNNSFTGSLPVHNIARSSASIGATLGQFVDAYELAIAPETDAVTIRKLRTLYQQAVCPSDVGDLDPVGKSPACPKGLGDLHTRGGPPGRWLYWIPVDAEIEGSRLPVGAISLGTFGRWRLFTTSLQRFDDFVLETLGGYESGAPTGTPPSSVDRRGRRGFVGRPQTDRPSDARPPAGSNIPQRRPPQDILGSPSTGILLR